MIHWLIVNACSLGLSLPFWFAEPAISRRFVADYNREVLALPQDQVAWRLIQEAALLPKVNIKGSKYEDVGIVATTPDDPLWPALVDAVERDQKLIQLAIEAGLKPRMGMPAVEFPDGAMDEAWWAKLDRVDLESSPPPLSVAFPQLGVLRRMARSLMADCRVAAEFGDAARVVRDVRAMLALPALAFDCPPIIGQLVGFSLFNLASNEIGYVLAAYPGLLDDDDLLCLLADLQIARTCLPTVNIDGDLESVSDWIQRTYSDDGRGNGIVTYSGLMAGASKPRPSLMQRVLGLVLDDSRLVGTVRAFGTRAQANSVLESARAALKQDADVQSCMRTRWTSDNFDFKGLNKPEFVAQFPVTIMLPTLRKAITAREDAATTLEAARCVIAIERYRLRHGVYPGSVEEACADGSEEVPTDRFTCQTLRFREQGQEPPLLYSVGVDRKDDHGRPGNSSGTWMTPDSFEELRDQSRYLGDFVYWPPQTVDFIDDGEQPFVRQRMAAWVRAENPIFNPVRGRLESDRDEAR